MRKTTSALRGKLGILGMVVTLVMAFGATLALGQVQFGEITGLVTDPSGAVVVGASVTLANVQTGVSRVTKSNESGYYDVPSLIPGNYDVTVSKSGFQTSIKSGVRLEVAQTARVDVQLTIGATTQQVTVKAGEAPLLQTQNASISGVVPQQGVVRLPLNGRNYLQLATLIPGANATNLGGKFFGIPTNDIQVNGMRNSATAYVIDGADVQQQFFDGTSFTPAPDAIQEFRVQTNNMSVEYGGGGAIINAVLKSGTNKIHGDVYEFLRNDVFDSRNFFAKAVPTLRQNQFGFTLGGPIKKDKAFLFGDYQGTRIRRGVTFNSVVPSAAERNGDFSALSKQLINPYTLQPYTNNQIPQGDMSQQSLFFLQYFPLPNTPSGTYSVNGAQSEDDNQLDLRGDYNINSTNSLTATYSFEKSNLTAPGAFPQNGGSTGWSRLQFGALGWTHNIGSSAVSQFHASWARTVADTTQQGLGTNYTEQAGIGGFNLTSLAYPGFPGLGISGYSSINGNLFLPLGQKYQNANISEVVNWIKGKHTITAGFDSRWYRGYNYNGAWSRGNFSFTGTYTGDAFADYLLGIPFQGSRSFPRNLFGIFQNNQAYFMQDQWKVTPHLTLIGGFRYDFIHPPTYLRNAYASTNILLDKIIVATGANGIIDTTAQQVTPIVLPLFQSKIVPSVQVGLPPSLRQTYMHGFAPRMGVAYDLGHDFVIRSGYGIFYPLTQGNQDVSTGIVNAPFIVDELSNFNTTPVPTKTLADMFPAQSPGNILLTPTNFFQVDPFMRYPMIQEWNFAVQKMVMGVFSLQAAYVGSHGTRLSFSTPLNIPAPGPGAIQSRRLNTAFSSGSLLSTRGISSYNALQLQGQTRSWHGLYLLSSYTWGKSLDNQSGDSQGSPVQNPNDILSEYGISSYNVASRLTVSSTYDLPFFRDQAGWMGNVLGRWSMNNIITVQSGGVFTPTISTSPSNTGTPNRPNRFGSGILSSPTIQRWFDPTAFGPSPAFTYGDTARNVLTGPGYNNWDFSLFKNFDISRLREGAQAQFRAEFFNFTNTTHFGLPNSNVQSPAAARILSASSPREIQFALKFSF